MGKIARNVSDFFPAKITLIIIVLVITILLSGLSSALTIYTFKIENKELEYGETLKIDLVFVGDGALRIKSDEGETYLLYTLKEGEYRYEINTEGTLYPGNYYVQILDEKGVEVANESLKIKSTYAIVVVTIDGEKQAKSYLYDILVVPTALKTGNNTVDVYFSSNTYSKGGADIYMILPDGWKSEVVHIDEIDLRNHVSLEIFVSDDAFDSYVLELNVNTTFGNFKHSYVANVEKSVEEPAEPEITPTPEATPVPTSYTPTPVQSPTTTPVSTIPLATTGAEEVETSGEPSPTTPVSVISPTPAIPTQTAFPTSLPAQKIPGFNLLMAIIAIAALFILNLKK